MKRLYNTFINTLFSKILFFFGILKDRWCLAIVDNKFKIKKIITPPKNFSGQILSLLIIKIKNMYFLKAIHI